MLTEKDYCDKNTCVALKEMGYKGMSRYYYTQRDHKLHYDTYNKFYTVRTADAMGYVLAIHLYDAQKWLREEMGIHIEITYSPACWTGKIYDLKKRDYIKGFTFFKSFEDTLHTLIKEAVKLLKEK